MGPLTYAETSVHNNNLRGVTVQKREGRVTLFSRIQRSVTVVNMSATKPTAALKVWESVRCRKRGRCEWRKSERFGLVVVIKYWFDFHSESFKFHAHFIPDELDVWKLASNLFPALSYLTLISPPPLESSHLPTQSFTNTSYEVTKQRQNACNVFVIKPTRCSNFKNLFCHEILHVSGSSSAHHQEFIHCTLGNGVCHTGL